jgi:hypothetical protein
MSHDFLGTFNRSQFSRFIEFARSQLTLVEGRINHLEAEISRVGVLTFKYQKGVPLGFAASPSTSYLAKLLAAYEVLGGNPPIDLRIRLRNDPVFVIKGTESSNPQYMANGEVVGARGLSDGPTSEYMHDAKEWLYDTLRYRFNGLERKIRRSVDYADQLQLELQKLKIIQLSATTTGSLEYIANQVEQLFGDLNYRAIFDDGGSDPYGLNIYAPFSSYDTAASEDSSLDRGASESAQRQNSGFVGPGSK